MEASGVEFQARLELAVIPNMMYMDAGLDGRWKRKATTKGRRHTAKRERKHGWRDLESGVRLKEIRKRIRIELIKGLYTETLPNPD